MEINAFTVSEFDVLMLTLAVEGRNIDNILFYRRHDVVIWSLTGYVHTFHIVSQHIQYVTSLTVSHRDDWKNVF